MALYLSSLAGGGSSSRQEKSFRSDCPAQDSRQLHDYGTEQRQDHISDRVGHAVADHRCRVAGDGNHRAQGWRAAMLAGDRAEQDGWLDPEKVASDHERDERRSDRYEDAEYRQDEAEFLDQADRIRAGR